MTFTPSGPNIARVIPRPTAQIRERATVSTTTSYKTIVSHIITANKYFYITKIIATWSGTDEQQIQALLGTEVVGEYHSSAYVIDYFAHDVKLLGDGIKTFRIQAKATSTTAALTGIINGEEV